MDSQINFDAEWQLYITEEDGTTPLDLDNVTAATAYLVTAAGEQIAAYVYGTDANFAAVGTSTGYYTLKFDHADNVESYSGDVHLVMEIEVADAAFESNSKVIRIGPERIGTIKANKPPIPTP